MATIKDVAKLANVSVATVSRVINNSTKVSPDARAAVQKAQQELNYHPNTTARTLAHHDSESIGVVVSDLNDPYFGAMVKAIDTEAQKHRYTLLINNGYHNAEKEKICIESLIKHRCKCIIAHTLIIDDDTLRKYMTNHKGMVLINRRLEGFLDRCVYLDDETGAYLAVKHLIANGHRNIGYIKSSHAIVDCEKRLNGYIKALEEARIPFNSNLIVEAEPTAQGGEEGAQTLLNSGANFSAIACYNDMQAAGAMAILIDNDIKIPENISIIGYDNMFISRYLQPRLTTIRNPITAMATTAVRIALALSNDEEVDNNLTKVFTPTLIKRFSVKDLNSF
jgi:LacI family transcriptional regulator